MIDKKTIIAFISSLTHGRKKAYIKQTLRPKREWFFGLVFFIVIVCVGGVYSVLSFTRFADIHTTLKPTTQTVESYKENTVRKALEIYTTKKNAFTELDETIAVETIPKIVPTVPIASSTVPDSVDETVSTSEAIEEASSEVIATSSATLSF